MSCCGIRCILELLHKTVLHLVVLSTILPWYYPSLMNENICNKTWWVVCKLKRWSTNFFKKFALILGTETFYFAELAELKLLLLFAKILWNAYIRQIKLRLTYKYTPALATSQPQCEFPETIPTSPIIIHTADVGFIGPGKYRLQIIAQWQKFHGNLQKWKNGISGLQFSCITKFFTQGSNIWGQLI